MMDRWRWLALLSLAFAGPLWPQARVANPSQTVTEAPGIDFTQCGQIAVWPEGPITLAWQPVRGAATYSVELDCLNCRNQPVAPPRPWFSTSGTPWHVEQNLGLSWVTDLVSTLREEGGRDLRWRVWGVDADGAAGPKSDWCVLPFSDSGKPVPGAPKP